MDRKQFLTTAGLTGIGAALCAFVPRCCSADAQATAATPAATPTPDAAAAAAAACRERNEFAEGWTKRFMTILKDGVDEPTRVRLLEANGRACYRAGVEKSKRPTPVIPYAAWAEKVKARGPNPAIAFDEKGFTIRFQGEGAGQPAGKCLCRLIEGDPSGVPPQYCDCSVGYVKENFGALFGQPVRVTLLESVLRGGQWCRFRVEPA